LPLFLFFTLQLPPSFYFVSLPLFISRKRERGHPALSRQGAGLHQGGEGRERKIVALQGNIIAFSSSVLCACRGRRRLTAPFKTAPFASFSLSLFLTVHETAPFCPKRAVSFKRK
jgi:hypothetical protein